MKTTLLFSFILSIFLFSCDSKKTTSEEAQANTLEIDLGSFDYIGKINFSISRQEIINMLPKDKKLVGDKEEGFAYDFTINDITHSLVVLNYGLTYFSDLNIELDFSKKTDDIEKAYMYINKALENRYENPITHETSSKQETITWKEETMDEDDNYMVILTKFEKQLTIQFLAQPNQEYDSHGTEGEWIQRGPNGDWVFMPNSEN